MKRKIIRLKIQEFMQAASEKELQTDAELAASIGVSVTQIWRAKLPYEDPRHNSPGSVFIAGVLGAFEGTFEEFFFLDDDLRVRNI